MQKPKKHIILEAEKLAVDGCASHGDVVEIFPFTTQQKPRPAWTFASSADMMAEAGHLCVNELINNISALCMFNSREPDPKKENTYPQINGSQAYVVKTV